MNKKFIIDSSALLAVIYKEGDHSSLDSYFNRAAMHIVNVNEVISVLHRNGIAIQLAENIVKSTITEILYSNFEEASKAAQIKVKYKKYGISTGDSFCLAAAKMNNYAVITADKIWSKLDDLGLEIMVIR